MRRLDYGAVWLLFALGCVHNFVAAPLAFDRLDTRALWFVTGGIVLWYAAIINAVQLLGDSSSPTMRWLTALANAILMAFAVTFMTVKQSWGDAQNIALLAPTAWLGIRSILRRAAEPAR